MLIDSNILIYSLNRDSPKQQTAQRFLHSQKQLIFAQQNIFETLRILTHSKFPNPFPTTEAIKAIALITDQAKVVAPTIETLDIALALTEKYQIKGAEVFDAYLVATAMSHGIAQIATDNTKHLEKYTEVEIVNPFS